MEQRNCKNCGAAIKHSYNHKCEYCGTLFDYNIKESEEIDPRNFRNVEFDRIRFDHLHNAMTLIFRGDYYKEARGLEYGNHSIFIDRMCFSEPKKVFYAIDIPIESYMEIFRENKFDKLFNFLPFDMDYEQFIQEIIKQQDKLSL